MIHSRVGTDTGDGPWDVGGHLPRPVLGWFGSSILTLEYLDQNQDHDQGLDTGWDSGWAWVGSPTGDSRALLCQTNRVESSLEPQIPRILVRKTPPPHQSSRHLQTCRSGPTRCDSLHATAAASPSARSRAHSTPLPLPRLHPASSGWLWARVVAETSGRPGQARPPSERSPPISGAKPRACERAACVVVHLGRACVRGCVDARMRACVRAVCVGMRAYSSYMRRGTVQVLVRRASVIPQRMLELGPSSPDMRHRVRIQIPN
ncbi:hypothetical protein DFH27DRAFT_272002 [Peziza echinospora]|nr:hypothetical protein DFH27DRAFT_272002 [Peziza echinospora]